MTRKDFEKWVPQHFANNTGAAQTQVDIGVTNQEKAALWSAKPGMLDPNRHDRVEIQKNKRPVFVHRFPGAKEIIVGLGDRLQAVPSDTQLPKREGITFVEMMPTDPASAFPVHSLCNFRGRLYAATAKGVFVYDAMRERFVQIIFNEPTEGIGIGVDVTA